MENDKKIVLSEENIFDTKQYYIGKTYMHQGECYPNTCSWSSINEAKTYKTKEKAIKACEKLNERTGRSFIVEEIE